MRFDPNLNHEKNIQAVEKDGGPAVSPDQLSKRYDIDSSHIQKSENSEDQYRVKEIIKGLEGDIEIGLSQEEKLDVSRKFEEFKKLIDTRGVSNEVRSFLLTTEVSSVVAGVKPMSYVQPALSTKKSFQVWKNKNGLDKNDLEDIYKLLRSMGISVYRHEHENELHGNDKSPHALLYIQRDSNVVSRMIQSGMFTEDEISRFKENPESFYSNSLDGRKVGYGAASRTGVMLGYPLNDVADFIELKKLEEKGLNLTPPEVERLQHFKNIVVSAETVKGLKGGPIGWVTTNPESKEVKTFIKRTKDAINIQNSIFNNEAITH